MGTYGGLVDSEGKRRFATILGALKIGGFLTPAGSWDSLAI